MRRVAAAAARRQLDGELIDLRDIPDDDAGDEYILWSLQFPGLSTAHRDALRREAQRRALIEDDNLPSADAFLAEPCPHRLAAAEIVDLGRRALAKRHRGDQGVMWVIDAAAAWLRGVVAGRPDPEGSDA